MKIIGILLLSVLGFVLFLFVLLLFCPFTYDVKGTWHEKQLTLHVRIGWLAKLLQFGVDEGEDEHSVFLKIFGIRKNLKKEKNPDNAEDFVDTIEDDVKETAEEAGQKLQKEPLPTLTALEYTDAQEEDPPSRQKKPGRGKLSRFWNRKKDGVRRMRTAFYNFKRDWNIWRRFLTDETNRQAFLFLRDQIFGLLKKILPRRMKLDLQFSTGSPDTTGQILGILAMFPMAYKNNWNVEADFSAETFYVEAAFALKGRIAAIQMVIPVVRILLDKNCRKLYNRFKHMRTMNEKK